MMTNPLIYALCGVVVLMAVLLRVYHRRVEGLKNRLRNSVRQRKEVMDFLSLFTTSLSTAGDSERAMELVAHYLGDVLDAESLCVFQLVEDKTGRKLQACAVAGMFPPLRRTANMLQAKTSPAPNDLLRREKIPVGDGVIGRVAELQRSLLIEDASLLPEDEKLPRDVRSLMAVPMFVENRLTGVVAAVNCKQPGRNFGPADLQTLENLSYQAAMASHFVNIYGERSRQQRITQELDLARQIQASLLPEDLPSLGDYRLHAFSRSALEVGGDFYDFIEMDEYRTIILVADASGKGVPASMLMAMCQSFAKAEAERFTMMEKFLASLNRHLCRDSDRSHFVTLAVLLIDRQNHVCEYARAGHTELLVRFEAGNTRIIKPSGPALGLLPDEFNPRFDTLSFAFPPGTSLMLFSDGITEALNEAGEEFGLERLYKIWRENDLPPEQMGALVLDAVKDFIGEAPQADDQTLLLVARPRGQNLARPGPPQPTMTAAGG